MNIRRMLAFVTAILLIATVCMPCALAESLLSVQVRSAPLVRSATVKNGMVRVWLSSLGAPTSLNVTAIGSYSVNGNTSMSLSDGDSVSISFDTTTGLITMTMNGLSYNMGKEMRLRRHQADGDSAVCIAEARRPYNLYPGDLQLLAVENDGAYRLYPIVHVYLEYYLYGVVPYEMSSSWPIEALMAQAVTARTYTVRRLDSRSGYNYDLTDTSSDQVYYGQTGTVTNATRAVDATKGIVIMNNGVLSGTYYTASNGGQTEAVKNAWGGTGYPYLGVKDDPFDASNTAAIRRKLTVYADFDHPNQNTALAGLLSDAAKSILGASAEIQTINSVTPHTPKYASPSRLYTIMDFGVTALAGTKVTDITLSFSIFDDLETPLGMNINTTTRNELWTAEAVDDGFSISVARYGHGIGMSQRGAQKMAQLGYTYDQILGFYYDGCERVQYTFAHTILSAGSSSEVIATEPPADITPSEQDRATVTLVGLTDSMPLRYQASESGKILTAVPNGAMVTVLAKGAEWSLVRYGEINGYLETKLLTFTGTPPTETTEKPTSISLWASVKGTNALNFREGPGTSYKIITELKENTLLCVLGTSGEWVRVQQGATVGYVSVDYLSYHNSYPGATIDSSSAMVSLDKASDTAKLLATPSTSSVVLLEIAHGTQVNVLSNDGTWCRVEAASVEGYLLTSQLDFNAVGVDPTDIPLPTGTPAVVNSDASSLNLREGPSTSDGLIAEIPKGTTIMVTTYGEEWCAVSWGNLTGYVMTRYLLFDEEEDPSEPTPTPGTTEKIAWVMKSVNYVNLRETANPEGKIITTIPSGDQVAVQEIGGTWTYVRHGSAFGYVLSKHLTYSEPLPSIGVMYVNTVKDPLTMRSAPNTSGAALTYVPKGEPVMLLEKLNGWCQVQYGAYVGYCSAEYLSFRKPNEPADNTPLYDPTLKAVTGWQAVVPKGTEDLIVSKWCSIEAPEVIKVPAGAEVELLEKGDIWCKITYEGETGYCLTKKLTLIEPAK